MTGCTLPHVRDIEMTKSKGMKVLRWLWMISMGVLFGMAIASIYFLPATVPALMQALPILTGITAVAGGIAFGGSAIKRGQNGKDS